MAFRFGGSVARDFVKRLGAVDFVNSIVLFSGSIVSDSKLYGPIGVVFTLLTWFIAIGAVIVLGAAGGATWEQRKVAAARPDPEERG